MSYWLCITTEENWKVIKERNVWDVPERHKNTIAKVKPENGVPIRLKRDGFTSWKTTMTCWFV